MAARARRIVPTGSAQARLGAELRDRRTERGLSLAKLGSAVHCSADLLRRVEATERFPARELIVACDSVLAADGALVELWPAAEEERRRSVTPVNPRRSTAPPVRFAPEASEALIADWSSEPEPPPTPPSGNGRLWVTGQDLAVAWDTLAMFRQLDHVHGAGVFAEQLRVYADSELMALLDRPVAGPEVEADRARLAAGFLELAGYQAVDAGYPGWAQGYYQRALEYSAASGDRGYGSYLVAVNLGHLALHCDQPETALRWAEAAHQVAQSTASPATRAAITAVQARAHARMGEEQLATKLMLNAEALLDGVDAEEEPLWIRYFNHAYLADELAHCLHDLGRAPAARDLVADALDGVGRDHVRRLAIDATLLASSWLRSSDLEQACSVGMEAVGFAARTASGRCIERLARLLGDMAPYGEQRNVAEFREFVREVLPSAVRATPVTAVRP
ncbi:helix-turn-helix domain-containing protein [Streptacidiphilus sp. MAP5-3]|uniref:helix-turn-helix transcriptional regulator n=1 Tax=unclassified Streptacidiphilus TaxID=2643834 RepID=UPI003517AE26